MGENYFAWNDASPLKFVSRERCRKKGYRDHDEEFGYWVAPAHDSSSDIGWNYYNIISNWMYNFSLIQHKAIIRSPQTAAIPTFAANRKEVLNLTSQEDLVPN